MKYVAIDDDCLVWGMGDSEDDALSDAGEWREDPPDLEMLLVLPASDRLARSIDDEGGFPCHIVNDIAVHPDEDK